VVVLTFESLTSAFVNPAIVTTESFNSESFNSEFLNSVFVLLAKAGIQRWIGAQQLLFLHQIRYSRYNFLMIFSLKIIRKLLELTLGHSVNPQQCSLASVISNGGEKSRRIGMEISPRSSLEMTRGMLFLACCLLLVVGSEAASIEFFCLIVLFPDSFTPESVLLAKAGIQR